MSEVKHTPGPWRVYGAQNGDYRIVYNESGNWLAEVFDDGEPIPGRVEADAHLIAAAPDLLEALKWFVERRSPIQAKLDLHGPADMAEAMRAAFSDAAAAIAKAKGPK